MDYENSTLIELRVRFAVRALGWTWWRAKSEGYLMLAPPPPRTRWNWAEALFDFVEGDWPEGKRYTDFDRYLYDDFRLSYEEDDRVNSPTFFPAPDSPAPNRDLMLREQIYRGGNIWRIVEAMRALGFPAQVYTETHTDPPRTQVNFEVSVQPYDYTSSREMNPEKAALVAALRCLDQAPKSKKDV